MDMEVPFALTLSMLLTFSNFLASASEFCSFIDWLDFDNWHIWKKTIIIEIIEGEYPFIMAFLISRHLNIISNIKQVKRAEYIIEIFSS